tara:strand:- start:58 stop:297 length:240 start_codon:yes stop_codon:yes gene_type:complete
MSTGSWGTSGWGSFPTESNPNAPWGHSLSSTEAFVIKERYIRLWLASMPLDLSRERKSLLSAVVDIIEETDYDIGGPVK